MERERQQNDSLVNWRVASTAAQVGRPWEGGAIDWWAGEMGVDLTAKAPTCSSIAMKCGGRTAVEGQWKVSEKFNGKAVEGQWESRKGSGRSRQCSGRSMKGSGEGQCAVEKRQ